MPFESLTGCLYIGAVKTENINPRISPRGLICKNEFLDGGLFEGGGVISKFSIFLKGRHRNDIIFSMK